MISHVSTFGGAAQQDHQIQSMQSQLTQLTGEISSGMKADPAGSMGNAAPLLYQLQFQNNQQTALQTSITLAGQRLDTIQTALTGINTAVTNLAASSTSQGVGTDAGATTLGQQAQDAMAQVLDALNTQFDGQSVFGGDGGATQPMQSASAAGGPQATIATVLGNAVAAKGGPLSAADVNNLLNGPNGLASVFSDTNSNPALNYTGAFYTGSTDGKPTKVLVGASQTVQYNSAANQPGYRDLLQGMSMLSLLASPSSQLDTSAKQAIQTQANDMISQGQKELTDQAGSLGVVQARLQTVSDQQQAAATATQQRILGFEQADTYTDATKLTALQTQLQASYEITAQISQMSLTHYFPSLA